MNERILAKLIKQKEDLIQERFRLIRQAETLHEERENLDKLIFKECEHVWVRDEWAEWDSLSKKVCSRCGLYPISAWYE